MRNVQSVNSQHPGGESRIGEVQIGNAALWRYELFHARYHDRQVGDGIGALVKACRSKSLSVSVNRDSVLSQCYPLL